MDNFVNWIMSHNTLLYSIFFGIMLIFACVFIVRYYVTNKSNLSAKQIVPLVITLVLFAYSFEQISWGHFYKLLGFNMFTFYFLLAFLYYDKISKRKITNIAFWFLLLSSILTFILGFIPVFEQYFWYGAEHRFAGIVGNPNTLQFCVAVTLAATLTIFFKGGMGRVEMYFKCLTLAGIGLLTKSKTFMVIFVLLLLTYLIFEFIYHAKVAAIELGTILVVFGVIYLIWGRVIIDSLLSRLYLDDTTSFINGITSDRWELWGKYLGSWTEDTWALLFGQGFSSPDFIYGGTHNDNIFVLYNLGIIGGVLVLGLGISYIVACKDKFKNFRIWNLVPVITIIAISCTENLLIRAFSLLSVFCFMFLLDSENYKKVFKKLSDSKVMLICTTDNMIWQFLLPHIKDMQDAGADVHLVCHKTGFWFDELKDMGFTMHNINMKRNPVNLTNIIAYFKLCKLQRKEKYDLVYCQQPVGGMLGRLVGARFRLPVIYTAHGLFFYKGNSKLKNFVYRSAERVLASSTDVFITMNDEDYNATIKWPPKFKYKIHGIGMNPDKYEKTKFIKNQLRQQLGLNDGDRLVISIGEFRGVKNYPTMAKVMQKVMQSEPDVKWLICGTGADKQDIENLVAELGIKDNVKFLGYRKDVDRIVRISDIMLHSSYREGLTMSIMEVMHFGLPVVTTTSRGNKDLIVDGEGGFTLDPFDVDAQSEAVIKLLNNPTLRTKMGNFNKQEVKKYYLDNVQSELKQIYKDCDLL